MIHFRHTGDFSKLTRFMERAKEAVRLGDLNKYGRAGPPFSTEVGSGLHGVLPPLHPAHG